MTREQKINELVKRSGYFADDYSDLTDEQIDNELNTWMQEEAQNDIKTEQASAPTLRYSSYYDNKAYLDSDYNKSLDELKKMLFNGEIDQNQFEAEWEVLNRDHNDLLLENENKYGKDKKLDRSLVARMDQLKTDMGLKDISTYDFINGVEDENGNIIVPPLDARTDADFQRAYTNMLGLKFDKPALENLYWQNPHVKESFKKWKDSGYDDRLRADRQVAYENDKNESPISTGITEFFFPYQTEKLRQGYTPDNMDAAKDIVGIGSMVAPYGMIGKVTKPVTTTGRIAVNAADNLLYPGIEYGMNLADNYDGATGRLLAQGGANLGISSLLNKNAFGKRFGSLLDPNGREFERVANETAKAAEDANKYKLKLIQEGQDLQRTSPNKATTSVEMRAANYGTPIPEDYFSEETLRKMFGTKQKGGDFGFDVYTATELGFKNDQNILDGLALPDWMKTVDPRTNDIAVKIPDFIPANERVSYLKYYSDLGNAAKVEALKKGEYINGKPFTDDLGDVFIESQEGLGDELAHLKQTRRADKAQEKFLEAANIKVPNINDEEAKLAQQLYTVGWVSENPNTWRNVGSGLGATGIGNVPYIGQLLKKVESDDEKVIEDKDKNKRKKKNIRSMLPSSSSSTNYGSASSMGGY